MIVHHGMIMPLSLADAKSQMSQFYFPPLSNALPTGYRASAHAPILLTVHPLRPNCPLYSSSAILFNSGSTSPVCGSVPNGLRKRSM